MEKAAEQQDRKDRADARERYQTEAVVCRILIRPHGGQADTHRHNKRDGDGTRGNAAGIEGDGEEVFRHEKGQDDQNQI